MKTDGLALEQAPPLSIPLSFFCTAPAAVLVAGVLVIANPTALTGPAMHPSTVTLTHLGTLGFLGMVMMGALYQMVPVLAGAAVPLIRSAHLVHVMASVGVLGLGYAAVHDGIGIGIAMGLVPLAIALGLFLVPVAWALWVRARADPTVHGMRVAISGLACLVVLGWLMAGGYRGIAFPGPRLLWISAHQSVALLGWVGALIVSVSWHVLPMFYLVPNMPNTARRITVPALALAVVGPLLGLASFAFFPSQLGLDVSQALVWATAAPAAIAVWLVHPVLTLRGLSARRRRRPDASVTLWRIGLVVGLLTFVTAGVALLYPAAPRTGLLLGWLAIWGWAASIVMGMLSRIVPFLVWFHRLSPWIGRAEVLPMRKLWPNRHTLWLAYAQAGSILCGALAILLGHVALARITGGLMVLVGVILMAAIVRVASHRGPAGDVT